jgi:hypothetical protein
MAEEEAERRRAALGAARRRLQQMEGNVAALEARLLAW